MVAGMKTMWGQGFRVYKSDGTVAQFSLRTDSIVFYEGIGTDVDFGPFTPVNQMIAGTWYKTKQESITFNEDGTTDYMEGATYEFLPYQGSLVIFNSSGAPVQVLRVPRLTADMLLLATGSSPTSFDTYSRTRPVQLVTGISFDNTLLTLQINETKQLTATVQPSDADDKAVIWESSDTGIATVDQTGKVTANSKGSCTITATAADGSGIKAECQVTVIQLVTGITLSETSITLSLPTNATHTLTATVVPPTASNVGLIWSSDKTSVATVDQTGKVTAKSKGSCTITATAADGSGVKAECQVNVIQLVTGITLSETSITLQPDESKRLIATIEPSDADNPVVTWTSSDEAVAEVNNTGRVTANTNGTCVITCSATDGSGVKAECQVTVGTVSQTYTVNGVSFQMIDVEGGTFQMGSNDSYAYSNEQPIHQVTLSSFSIGETEVTQALWYAVMGAKPTSSNSWSTTYGLGDNYPAYYVSWNDCQTFITKLNQLTGKTFRLPTEAEWEYAARGGNKSNGYTYSGSNTIDDVAWCLTNHNGSTHNVATKAPNELGIYDMSGNVWEWCQDWYGSYSGGSQTNPSGPSSGSNHVTRGGSYSSIATYCRVANRGNSSPTTTYDSLGFRLAL